MRRRSVSSELILRGGNDGDDDDEAQSCCRRCFVVVVCGNNIICGDEIIEGRRALNEWNASADWSIILKRKALRAVAMGCMLHSREGKGEMDERWEMGDGRGGQRDGDWEINKPESLQKVLNVYETISNATGASIADVIVLAGNVGIEKASGVNVPFTAGRGDASQEQTDIESFAALEPHSDAFRNFHKSGIDIAAEEIMLDKAQLLGLSAPEMTVLLGGMRSLGISASGHGVFTNNPDELSNDYFNTLLDMSVEWKPNGTGNSFEALNRSSGEKVRTATRADLVFGSNSQLRAICEVYASNDANEKFMADFISAWNKVMGNDLFQYLAKFIQK